MSATPTVMNTLVKSLTLFLPEPRAETLLQPIDVTLKLADKPDAPSATP